MSVAARAVKLKSNWYDTHGEPPTVILIGQKEIDEIDEFNKVLVKSEWKSEEKFIGLEVIRVKRESFLKVGNLKGEEDNEM